jgi:hypothetical protein
MAIENFIQTLSFKAGADMSASNYKFVKLGTNAQEALDATDGTSSAGDFVIGIRRTSPVSGRSVEVIGRDGDLAKLTLGVGGATKGAKLKSDSAGKGIVASTNKDNVGAIAMEAGVAGESSRFRFRSSRCLLNKSI